MDGDNIYIEIVFGEFMDKGILLFGVILALICGSLVNYVTIPAIYDGAEGAAEGLNDMGENGATGNNLVQVGGNAVWIYVVGWGGSIAGIAFTVIGIGVALYGLVKK